MFDFLLVHQLPGSDSLCIRGAHPHPPLSTLWIAHLDGILKINCDGSWDKMTGAASSGIIIRNPTGNLVDEDARRFQALSADIAECQALLDGIKLAYGRGFSQYIVEIDSKICYSAVQKDPSLSN